MLDIKVVVLKNLKRQIADKLDKITLLVPELLGPKSTYLATQTKACQGMQSYAKVRNSKRIRKETS